MTGAVPAPRTFVVVGNRAVSSDAFSLEDLPGTSGRLDVLLRCLRAALLTSHGIREHARVYLVLLGDPDRPRTVRVDGAHARFIRPDERALAVLLRKTLATAADDAPGFHEVRPGISVARGGLEVALADVAGAPILVLDETADDVRAAGELLAGPVVAVVGDPTGIAPRERALLDAARARSVSVGPVSLHSDDVVAVLSNELDRAAAR